MGGLSRLWIEERRILVLLHMCKSNFDNLGAGRSLKDITLGATVMETKHHLYYQGQIFTVHLKAELKFSNVRLRDSETEHFPFSSDFNSLKYS